MTLKQRWLAEAVNILKSVKARESENSYHARAACFQALNAAADATKDPEQVRKVFQTMVDKNYIDVSNINLGPIIKAYLLKWVCSIARQFSTQQNNIILITIRVLIHSRQLLFSNFHINFHSCLC